MHRDAVRVRALIATLAAIACVACERGCARSWIGRGGAGEATSALVPLAATDCPDGLARCEDGVVSVSRLATIAQPCAGPPGACECPWDRAATCERGCAAEAAEVVMDRAHAQQLCAPDAAWNAPAAPAGAEPRISCEEQRFVCSRGVVFLCATGGSTPAEAACARGCVAEGAGIDDERVGAVAAVAILCTR